MTPSSHADSESLASTDHSTLDTAIDHVSSHSSHSENEEVETPYNVPIAIVGLGCRLPGDAASPSELWKVLLAGQSTHSGVPRSRFNVDGFVDPDPDASGNIPRGGHFLRDDIRLFDNSFFGMSNLEASQIDPQQRLLLEVVYECLESAGQSIASMNGSNTGVYVANFFTDYTMLQFPEADNLTHFSATGLASSVLANRISYVYNLNGPSLVIDTACSSSLYALHAAATALRSGDCDSAVVASSNLVLSPEVHHTIAKAGVLSPESRCRSFDADAHGYSRADGVNALLLKPLTRAIRDGDPIRGVIRGSATNSDGKTMGLSLPSADLQASVIQKAYKNAGVGMESIQYVEAHGTGTPVGDPLEIEGLTKAMKATGANQKLLTGSVKSNLGHSEAASGISSIIKVILSMEHGQIPPSINIEHLNPRLEPFQKSVEIVRKTIPWPGGSVRRAGINSFGFGGSNAHVVLESGFRYRHKRPFHGNHKVVDPHRLFLLPLSTHSEGSLAAMRSKYGDFMKTWKGSIEDLTYTLGCRRPKMQYRAFTLVDSTHTNKIFTTDGLFPFSTGGRVKAIESPDFVFVFPGQGAQWNQMAAGLLSRFPLARSIISDLDGFLSSLEEKPDWTLESFLNGAESQYSINDAHISQPVCTALQIILVDLLRSWSIEPRTVVGHSSGEIAAAYATGALTAKEAIAVAWLRGLHASRLAESGAMVAVGTSANYARKAILDLGMQDKVSLACVNSPQSVTLSGQVEGIEAIRQHFVSGGSFARLLKTGGMAYHSNHMQAAGEAYEVSLRKILSPRLEDSDTAKSVEMLSTVTGTKVEEATLRQPSYWRDNLQSTVEFDRAMSETLKNPFDFVVELGPHSVLKSPIQQIWSPNSDKELQYLPTLQRNMPPEASLLSLAGNLFLNGVDVRFGNVNAVDRAEVVTDLPSYPWDHNNVFWSEPRHSRELRNTEFPRHYLLGANIPGGPGPIRSWRNILRLKNIPWLDHHRLRGTVVLPGAAYISLALEALRQCMGGTPLQDAIRVRQFFINKALIVPEDSNGIEIVTTMAKTPISATTRSKKWFTFEVCSFSGNLSVSHATGEIAIQAGASHESLAWDVKHDALYSHEAVYKKLQEVGLEFGPSFMTAKETRLACSEEGTSRMRAKSTVQALGGTELPSACTADILHPTLLDTLFQTAALSGAAGDLDRVRCHIPASVRELVIEPSRTQLPLGEVVAHSQPRGFGTLRCDGLLKDESGLPVLSAKGIRVIENDTSLATHVDNSRRPLLRVSWKPDVDRLSERTEKELKTYIAARAEEISLGQGDGQFSHLQSMLDLVLHKRSECKILMLASESDPTASALIRMLRPIDGLQRFGSVTFGTFKDFTLKGRLATDIPANADTSNDLVLTDADIGSHFDVIITKSPQEYAAFQVLSAHASAATSNEKAPPAKDHSSASTQTYLIVLDGLMPSDTMPERSQSLATRDLSDNAPMPLPISLYRVHPSDQTTTDAANSSKTIYLLKDGVSNPLVDALQRYLASLPSTKVLAVDFDYDSVSEIPDRSVIIFPTELNAPLLDSITDEQFRALQYVTNRAKMVLWLTQSDFLQASDPSTGLVYGLARSLMLEQPALKLATFDLDSDASSEAAREDTFKDLVAIMDQTEASARPELEYAKHEGLLYCSRFIPDTSYNKEFRLKQSGSLTTQKLGSVGDRQIECRALGQLDTLHFRELPPQQASPQPGFVDVLVEQVSLNYKDLAVAYSNVDVQDGVCGFEFAGTVASDPSPDSSLRKGDKVVAFSPTKFRKHERVPEWTCEKISADEDAGSLATLPVIFSTAIHAIEDIARLQPGESILIHSAAGGLGQAAIQIAQLNKLDIYVTAGTEEKRNFLSKRYGLDPQKIFSSRDDSFVRGIMDATDGEGVDAVINALMHDLLHASVQCCATFGRFIEVGRRDIEDAGTLDMSIFSRDITFTAFDLSHYFASSKKSHRALLERLLKRTITLYRAGTIHAAEPIRSYDVSQISEAFGSLMDRSRMGKVTVDLRNPDSQVQVLPRTYDTRFDPCKEYLLIGGLGGLGRSVSAWMVNQGARHLTYMSRSGTAKGQSQQLIEKLESQGVAIRVAKGSVESLEDLQRVLRDKEQPIGGVIHAAMDLDEALFTQLDVNQWHKVIGPKVRGAWNLHHALAPYESELDFFIMTSSVAGCVGTATEANYSAANSFLDSFARYRRGKGLKAIALGLGMISEVGYLHEHPDIQKLMLRRGIHPINQKEKLQIFDIAIQSENDTSILGSDDMSGCLRGHMLTGLEPIGLEGQRQLGYEGDNAVLYDARSSLFARNFASASERNTGTGSSDALSFLADGKDGFDVQAARRAVTESVKRKISNLLLMPVEQLHDDTLLSQFGMDSMLGAEFRAHIFHVLHVDLPFMLILGSSTTIATLTDMVVEKLGGNK